jgi:hypothetical protein
MKVLFQNSIIVVYKPESLKDLKTLGINNMSLLNEGNVLVILNIKKYRKEILQWGGDNILRYFNNNEKQMYGKRREAYCDGTVEKDSKTYDVLYNICEKMF